MSFTRREAYTYHDILQQHRKAFLPGRVNGGKYGQAASTRR